MMNFIDNDTVALTVLGIACIAGILMGLENLGAAAIGAIGGYIGGKAVRS